MLSLADTSLLPIFNQSLLQFAVPIIELKYLPKKDPTKCTLQDAYVGRAPTTPLKAAM